MELEEELSRDDGWLDDDGALESFLQEDALLDAIRNAPEVQSEEPDFEDGLLDTAPVGSHRSAAGHALELAEATSAASHQSFALTSASGGSGALSSAARGATSHTSDAVPVSSSSESQNVHRFEIEAGTTGPKERRSDLEKGGATDTSRGAPQRRAKASPGEPPKARAEKKFPWQGVALAIATLLWMLIWGPDFGLSEGEVKAAPSVALREPQRAPEIRMPKIDEDVSDENLQRSLGNISAPRRVSIDSERRSSNFMNTNVSAGAAVGNVSDSAGPNERGRRGRRRGGAEMR